MIELGARVLKPTIWSGHGYSLKSVNIENSWISSFSKIQSNTNG